MKTTFTAEQFGDNWNNVVEQLKEKFYAALRYGDVVVVTDSPYLNQWSLCNYSFKTNWIDADGNEYICYFNIDEELSSITIEGCEWKFDWEEGPGVKVEIYKLNPIEPDLSEVGVQKDVISEIVESAKSHGLYSACLSLKPDFGDDGDGTYFFHVQHSTEDNEVSAWFEIYNKRYPLVPRDNEQKILSFWKQFGDDDPKEILSANLTQEEFDSLVPNVPTTYYAMTLSEIVKLGKFECFDDVDEYCNQNEFLATQYCHIFSEDQLVPLLNEMQDAIELDHCYYGFNGSSFKPMSAKTIEEAMEEAEVGVLAYSVSTLVQIYLNGFVLSSKNEELYKAAMSYKDNFVQNEQGVLFATVFEKTECNEVSVWLEIKTYRFPFVERENEYQELILWKRVGDNDPKELFYVKLNDEEFNDLVNA